MVSILSLFFGILLHTALACTRWSPHSRFWLRVLWNLISSRRCTVLDFKKKKKENHVNPIASRIGVIPMAWIDKTSNAVQLNGFFGKRFFFNLFSQSATLPVYLFVSLFVNLQFLSYYFSALNIFQGFSLNFARTLECAVDKLLNGPRVIHTGSLFLESKAWVCFEAAWLSNKTEGIISHIFKTGLFSTFYFIKVNCWLWKSRVKYTIWTDWNTCIRDMNCWVHFRQRKFF